MLEPETYVSLLKAAQKLRNFFFDYLFPDPSSNNKDDFPLNRFSLLQQMINNHSGYQGSYKHPFLALITPSNSSPYLMATEALMYLLLRDEIRKYKNETLAGLFHFYLLILGLTNRLVVQQTHQNGFDQFQKHTLNGLRERSEKIYLRRYFQMHGNDSKHLHFLEGRFSPKRTEGELILFIDSIWKGWEKMSKDLKMMKQHKCSS